MSTHDPGPADRPDGTNPSPGTGEESVPPAPGPTLPDSPAESSAPAAPEAHRADDPGMDTHETPRDAGEPDAGEPSAGEPSASEGDAGSARAAEPRAPRPPRTPPPPPLPKAAGTIQSLEEEDAVILLEDGRTARMRKVDLADAQGKIHAVVGDRVEGGLSEEAEGALRLVKRSARAEAIDALADLFTSKTPIEGRITHAVKGGFEVRINGLRAFCPSSQISLRRDDIQGDPVGQSLQFVLTKWDPEGRSLVVSRRKLLEREQKRQAAEAKGRIAPGARMTGRVVGFQPYGAFVDLGGIQGLLHVSEMSHARIQDPRGVVSIGEEIEVVVLKHDETFKKVSLSRKALEQDPWEVHGSSLTPGRVVRGTCKRVASVGAFVELQPGLEGLLPARIDGESASDLPPAGAETLVRIVDVDPRRHRVTLAPAPEGAAEGDVVEPPAVEKGARIEGFVDHVVPFGVFVRLAPRKTGLLHGSESRVPQGGDLAAAFPVGGRVMVEVLDISEDGQKIRLTRRSVAERAGAAMARAAARAGAPGAQGAPGAPGGGRGDERGPRRGPGGPGGDRGRPSFGGGGPGGGRPGMGDRGRPSYGGREGGGGGGREGGGRERRPRREGGGEPVHNPAAAPRTGFAVIGDAFRAQLEAREAARRAAAEAEEPAGAGESAAPDETGDQSQQ